MKSPFALAAFAGIVFGSVVAWQSSRLPPVGPVDVAQLKTGRQIAKTAKSEKTAPALQSSAREAAQSQALTTSTASSVSVIPGPTWFDIPMDQFSKMTDPMPSIILPPPSNPGPRTRAPWWHYHYVWHRDGKTWHVEPTVDRDGNPIPIYWPE